MQHEALTQRAAKSAGDDAFNNNENWWSSSFFDSTLWWTGEAVIASTEITSDGETMPYICVPYM